MLKQQPEPIELNVFLTKIDLYVHMCKIYYTFWLIHLLKNAVNLRPVKFESMLKSASGLALLGLSGTLFVPARL